MGKTVITFGGNEMSRKYKHTLENTCNRVKCESIVMCFMGAAHIEKNATLYTGHCMQVIGCVIQKFNLKQKALFASLGR
jgi:hypothetical protein